MASRLPTFSAASGRGLIEARSDQVERYCHVLLFSAASGRGLIEAVGHGSRSVTDNRVFRGIGPRPH